MSCSRVGAWNTGSEPRDEPDGGSFGRARAALRSGSECSSRSSAACGGIASSAGIGSLVTVTPSGTRSISISTHGSGRWPNSSRNSRPSADVDTISRVRAATSSIASTSSSPLWNRASGAFASIRMTSSSTSGGRSRRRADGGGGSSVTIAVIVSKSLARRYSRSVVSISHITMPSENRSLRRSTLPPRHCSGDR